MKQKDCRFGPLKNRQENLVTDDKQKAEIVNSYFTTIGQSLAEHMESTTNINSVEYIYRVTPTCQQLEIDEEHFNQQFNPIHTWLFWLVWYRGGGGGGEGVFSASTL